ncbi:MAG: bifunctional DNA primase/polymerase [Archaeoglobaceae archaeon]
MNKESKLIELFYTLTSDDIYFNLKHITNYVENVDLLIPIKLERKENSHKFAKKPLVKWKTTDKDKVIQVIKSEYPCGIAIILDNYDFVILDIDNVELFEEKVVKIEELLNERNYIACVRTISGGYHFYLKRSEYKKLLDFNQINNKKLLEEYGFEIRYQGLLLVIGSMTTQFETYKLIDINFEPESTIIKHILNYLLNEEHQEEYDANINKLAKEVLSKVKFDDIPFLNQFKVKEYNHYTVYHCPFHTPDHHPSFAVYKNEKREIAVDFHDYKKYNVITFLAKYENISVKDAILRLSKLNNVTLDNAVDNVVTDESKSKKKKKKTIEDVDLDELKNAFISIFNIKKVEFYYNEKREKYYRFYTNQTEFDIKAVDLLELNNFLKCYFNYHTRIPRAWYFSEYQLDISLFFDAIIQDVVETAEEITDLKFENIVDTIIFTLKHAPVVYDILSLRSDFLIVVKHNSKYIFRFEALMNNLSKLHSIKLKTNEVSYILQSKQIAVKGERVNCSGDKIRVWSIVSSDITAHYEQIEASRAHNEQKQELFMFQ